MASGNVHGRSVQGTNEHSGAVSYAGKEAARYALDRRRAVVAEASDAEADRRPSELPAVEIRKIVEAQVAGFEDSYKVIDDLPNMFYEKLILLDGIAVCEELIEVIDESVDPIEACKTYSLVLSLIMANVGSRSAKQFVSALIVNDHIIDNYMFMD